MGKVLGEKVAHKIPIDVGSFTASKAIRVDGNVYDSTSLYSVSDYIDITGYDRFYITCTLWASTGDANCTIVGLYDENKSFIGILLHPLYISNTRGIGVQFTEQHVCDYSGRGKYIRISNYNNGAVKLYGDDSNKNSIHKVVPLTSGWINGWSASRKCISFYPPLLFLSNGIKITITAKVKSEATSIDIALFDKVYRIYVQGGQASSIYDSGWQTEFDDFEVPSDTRFETLQFRLMDDSLTDDSTEADINALLEYAYMTIEADISADDVLVQYDALVDLLNQQKKDINYFTQLKPVVNSVNHRGFNTVAPENTMPAFRLSVKRGFYMLETDICFTSDNVAVLLHDSTINRTARNADGTAISSSTNISSITYEQALEYDFGIWKSEDYAGTKIPTLQEFLLFCRASGAHPYLELKTGMSASQAESVVGLVDACGMRGKVTYISFNVSLLNAVKGADEKARLGYIVNDALSATHITSAQGLQTDKNEVFIDGSSLTSTSINLCMNANIPYEVWTIDSSATILALDPYITGVTSNSLNASDLLFDSLELV